MTTGTKSPVFAGEPEPLGGLTNELELAKVCPPEFKRDNPWSYYAGQVFFFGASVANWKWKSDDEKERLRQKACLRGLVTTFNLDFTDVLAVAGWMLSEMLSEVPKHVPAQK